ncbi:hypothetical protein AADZ86_18890 [Colwelliaceae bacterium BS250]
MELYFFKHKTHLLILTLIIVAIVFFQNINLPISDPIIDTDKESVAILRDNILISESKLSAQPLLNDVMAKGVIIDCDSEYIIDEKRYFEVQQHFASLANTNLKDKKLEYVMYAKLPPDKTRLDLLIEYDRDYPNTSLALMEALYICTGSNDNENCTKQLVESATASDKENAATWFNAVLFHAERNNDSDVLNAIDGMLKASIFNEKRGERIKLYANALKGSEVNDFSVRVISGIGVEAARSLNISSIIRWCKNGLNETVKSNSCLLLGNDLQNRGKELISQWIGIALQKLIYKSENNTKRLEELERETEQSGAIIMSNDFQKASSLMFHDEGLLFHWLDNLDLIGEVESANLLIEEATILSHEKGPNICKA